jgi:hypothetical protein
VTVLISQFTALGLETLSYDTGSQLASVRGDELPEDYSVILTVISVCTPLLKLAPFKGIT